MAAMSAESRAEYLKKYLEQPKEKKKRKRKDISTKNLRIIEEDSFLPIPDASPERSKRARKSEIHSGSDSEDEESKLLAAAKRLKEAEANKFRVDTFVSIDNEEANRNSDRAAPSSSAASHKEPSNVAVKPSGTRSLRHSTREEEKKSDESPPRRHGRDDSDASPPRRRKHEDSDECPPRRRGRNDPDTSPSRRRRQDASPPRRCKEEVVSDSSPPRRGRNDSDASPPRRHKRDDSDESPPRRRGQDDSDASPPRRHRQNGSSARKRKDSDASPPRRRGRNEQNASPPRRRKHDDSDESPPRQRGRGDADASPPRRRRQDASSIRQFKQEISDASPPRRRSTSPSSRRRNRISPEKISSHVKQEKNIPEEEETPFAAPRKRETLFQRNKRGKEPEDPLKKARESAKQKEWEAKYSAWGKGLHQAKEREAKLQEMGEVAQENFTRYADDEAMNAYLKEQIYDDLDPMAKYYRTKQEKIEMKTGTVYPKYKGHWAPNRFGIAPGYRWDGVDRSNGFEAKMAGAENERKAQEAIAYRSIVECEE